MQKNEFRIRVVVPSCMASETRPEEEATEKIDLYGYRLADQIQDANDSLRSRGCTNATLGWTWVWQVITTLTASC
ncbi:hypothetical protein BGX23_012147 [Mortierella sp. AD031]|nr:hypothetical protein BGX23_012147 [Mortierella sp. AD031]